MRAIHVVARLHGVHGAGFGVIVGRLVGVAGIHAGHAGHVHWHVHSGGHFVGGGRGLLLGRSLILGLILGLIGLLAWMLGRLGGQNLRAGEGQERCQKKERGGDKRFAHLHIC